jgi:hypothetical protein
MAAVARLPVAGTATPPTVAGTASPLPVAGTATPLPVAGIASPLPVPVPGIVSPLPVPVPGIGNAVGSLAKDSANTVLDAVASWVSAGATSLLGALAGVIDQHTNPADTKPWFTDHFGMMAAVAADLAIPLLFAVAITAVVRRDLSLLLRAAFVQLPLAFIGTAAAMAVVGMALSATDELCSYVTTETHIDAAGLLRNLIVALSHGGPNVTGFGLVLVSLLIATGGFFLTVELVVREAAIWVAMLFLPLALLAFVWPATARWGRRLAELLVALILSKFVIVAVVSMAVSATTAGVARPDLGPLFGGAALLLLAAAAPFTLLRMVPVVEAGVVAHLEGVGRRAVSAPPVLQQAALHTAQSQISRLLEQRGSRGGAPTEPPTAVGGEPAATAVPTRGRESDGTQSAPDKPVPAESVWRNAVRVVPTGTGGPDAPGRGEESDG